MEKEKIDHINELEHDYKINNCEKKGHLQALQFQCNKLKSKIELNKKVSIYI